MSEKVTSTDRKSETKGEKTSSLIQKSCSSQNIESTVDRILFLQRTMGNQKVGMLISSGALQAKFMNPKTVNGPTLTMGDSISDTVVQRTPDSTSNLTRLRQVLRDDHEDEAIQLMGTLNTEEIQFVLSSREFKELAIGAFNNNEMYRGMRAMHGDLYLRLEWMFDEGTDWSKVRVVIREHPASGKSRVLEDNWMKEQFVSLCNDEEMAEAVDLLGGTLLQKLRWMLAEGTNAGLVYNAIRKSPGAELPIVLNDRNVMDGLRKELNGGEFARVQQMLSQGLLSWEGVDRRTTERHYERETATSPWELTTFDWSTVYEIQYTRTQLKIIVRIKLQGTPITDAQRTSWITAIQNRWNGHFHIENDRRLAIVFEPIFTSTHPHHTVEIHAGSGRADMGNWYVNSTGDTAAHEFGHMIGFEDEYNLTTADYTRLIGTAPPPGPEPAGGYTEPGLMGTATGNAQGRHLRPFLSWLNSHRMPGERPYNLVPGP